MSKTRPLAALLLLLAAAAPPAPVRHARAARPAAPAAATAGVVLLAHRPFTAEDAVARRLTAADLRTSRGAGDPPLVLVGSARIGPPTQRPALFVQLQSADLCGSAGCSTSVYLSAPRGWRKVLDSVSGPIRVDAAHRHGGMADLVVGDDDRWTWNGTTYADTVSAPVIDLKKSVEQHRAAVARGGG